MSSDDVIVKKGTKAGYKDDRGSAVLYDHPVIGVVKDNIDPTHTGRIKVFLAKFGGNDPDDDKQWVTVKYLSPYFGVISPDYNVYTGSTAEGYGKFVSNPHSYGLWATAPDVGSQVICIFINGDPNDGYYIGGVPYPGLTHMVPAIGATAAVVPNAGEAETYGGADRLPVTEVNYTNKAIRNSSKIYSEPKPVHSYQASILLKQGLIRDNIRGVIGSSSQRETPSKVFGISTPGQAIYEGGYTNKTIVPAAKSKTNNEKLQIIGRTGGHTIVLDDGNLKGEDQLMRFRTTSGHMLLMSDNGQVVTLIHANGQSYIELGKEGTVDIFTSNSINLRSQGDINFHADRDINLHAKRNFTAFAENIKFEADQNLTWRTGKDFQGYAMGKFTVKVDGAMSMTSAGDSSYASSTTTYINGAKIYLNTGSTGTVPAAVPAVTKIVHVDTTWSPSKGWINPSPEPLLSVSSRTPAHMPWAAANKGVDVTSGSAQSPAPPAPTAAVQAANQATPAAPQNPTTPAVAQTTPPQTPPSKCQLPGQTVTTMASQQAVNSATATPAQRQAQGVIPGAAGVTLQQVSAPGQMMKPGAGEHVAALQSKMPGMPFNTVASNVLMTGANGVKNATDLVKNTAAQLSSFTSSVASTGQALINNGILTGKEAPTQVAGVIMAGVNAGVSTVTNILKNPASAVANLTSNPLVSNLIAGGKFAAGMADNLFSGLSGLGNSIATAASGALKSLGSAANGLLGKASTGINSLIDGLAGAARNAYSVAEASFKNLKAGQPNFLGGLSSQSVTAPSASRALLTQLDSAQEELDSAESELRQAKKAYGFEESAETYSALKEAEGRLASANQKLAQINQQLSPPSNAGNLFGNVSAQASTTIANAATSGLLNVPTTLNTGLNALPGGINSFVNQVKAGGSNIINGLKTLGTQATNILQNPSKLVGNLVQNATASLTGLASNLVGAGQKLGNAVSGALNGAGQAVGNLLSGAQNAGQALGNLVGGAINSAGNAISSLLGGAASSLNGLLGNLSTALDSLGNAPAQIKAAVLATDTFAPKAAITSKMTAVLGDNRVPSPTFDETPVEIEPDTYQELQVQAQEKIEDLVADRGIKQIELDTITKAYVANPQPALLTEIENLQSQISTLDIEIEAAQKNLQRVVENS